MQSPGPTRPYGFRPGRRQHDALDAVAFGITCTKVNWILDADIRSFFDTISHEWLIRFLEHRIGDQRLLRLIHKWLKAGVLKDGVIETGARGTPQEAVVSPLLANVYLHYVFDLWAHRWRKRCAQGSVMIVRYADDIVVGFEYERDAHVFLSHQRERFGMYSLELHRIFAFRLHISRYVVSSTTCFECGYRCWGGSRLWRNFPDLVVPAICDVQITRTVDANASWAIKCRACDRSVC